MSSQESQEHDISWALKLLEREPDYEQNLLAKNWAYICCTISGVAIPSIMNGWLRRPVFSGIQRHISGAVIGFGIGHLLDQRDLRLTSRRDAMMRDYIQRHPEDFPPPERKKYGEIFEPWVPVR